MGARRGDDGAGSPRGERPGPVDRLGRPPRAVWLITAVFGASLVAAAVLTPLFHAPDESAHTDLVLAMADDPSYPAWNERIYSEAIDEVGLPWFLFRDVRNPRYEVVDAPDRHGRQSLAEMGGSESKATGIPNHQAQHPPLYYEALGGLVRLVRDVYPGTPAAVTEVMALRLVNALLVVWLPLAGWATAKRLGAGTRTGITTAALVASVPQLTHIGASVNNDNLLVALGAALAVLLAGVARGDGRVRTAVLVAVVTAAALWTKAFAFAYLPWVAVAYGLAAWRRRGGGWLRGAVLPGAIAGLGALLAGGWWWARNLDRYGEVSPGFEALIYRRPTFEPDGGEFARRFGSWFTERFWGWFGYYSARVPVGVVIVASGAVVAALVAALVRPRRAARADLLVALVPGTLVVAYVTKHAWDLHARSGTWAFIQGRYLFCAIIPLMSVVAVGAVSLLGRRASVVAVIGAVTMQVVGALTMLRGFWGGDGAGIGEEIRAMQAWNVWPPGVTGTLLVLAAVVLLGAGGAAVVDLAGQTDEEPEAAPVGSEGVVERDEEAPIPAA